MKKTELYQSIDNLKPDRSMKERIMKAAETNDRITVHKRPIFIPVAAALLLAVNAGILGSFMCGDKFQSRLSVNNRGVVDIDLSEKDPEFERYADEVFKEIENYDYVRVEFMESSDYTPMTDYAWFDKYSREEVEDGKASDECADPDRAYVRYIQREGEYYTNHEYIIGYDGGGYDRENMISITESDVDYDHEPIEDHLEEIYANWENIGVEALPMETDGHDLAVKYTESTAFDIGASTYALDPDYDFKIFRYLPKEYNGAGDEQLCFRYHMMFTGGEYSELYMITDEIGTMECLTSSFGSGYWKETVSGDGVNYKAEALPKLSYVDREKALLRLEELGFTNVSFKYSDEPGGVYDAVKEYGNGMKAGDVMRTDTAVELIIYPKIMPSLVGLSEEDANTILENKGIKYRNIVWYGAQYMDDGNIYDNPVVADTDPAENELLSDGDVVTIYVTSDSSCFAEDVLWTEMELDYSYSENGKAYYVSDKLYPDMIFEGQETSDGMVIVNGVYTKSGSYEMCSSLMVGVSLETLKEILEVNEAYENPSDIYTIDSGDFNYEFTYTGADGFEYQVQLKVTVGDDGSDIISQIYVTKAGSEN